MKSPWICALRSVALTVPDLAAAETFYTCTWRLEVAGRGDDVVYLRGTGKDHHLLALHAAPGTPRLLKVTLRWLPSQRPRRRPVAPWIRPQAQPQILRAGSAW